jgi:hypothetical protein
MMGCPWGTVFAGGSNGPGTFPVLNAKCGNPFLGQRRLTDPVFNMHINKAACFVEHYLKSIGVVKTGLYITGGTVVKSISNFVIACNKFS